MVWVLFSLIVTLFDATKSTYFRPTGLIHHLRPPEKKYMLPSWHRKIQRGRHSNPSENARIREGAFGTKKGSFRFFITPWKTNECPLKRDYFNRKYIFQPSTFRGHVSLRECKVHEGCCGSPITNSKWGSVKLKEEGYIHYSFKKKDIFSLVVGSYESITNPIGFVVFKSVLLYVSFLDPFCFLPDVFGEDENSPFDEQLYFKWVGTTWNKGRCHRVVKEPTRQSYLCLQRCMWVCANLHSACPLG